MSGDSKPFIYVRGEGGAVHKLDLPLHETIADQLRKGTSVQVNADGTPYVEDVAPAPVTQQPAKGAGKPEWVAWAVHNGAVEAEAEALSKQALIDKYGQGNLPASQVTVPAVPATPSGDGAAPGVEPLVVPVNGLAEGAVVPAADVQPPAE